ncbi:MAG: hypothetical protein DCC49_00740 [Acidobacteria bacterium]|nr:MAG: hypothetical protein DCC49_00740 [Acidobacteriota bacterium]
MSRIRCDPLSADLPLAAVASIFSGVSGATIVEPSRDAGDENHQRLVALAVRFACTGASPP